MSDEELAAASDQPCCKMAAQGFHCDCTPCARCIVTGVGADTHRTGRMISDLDVAVIVACLISAKDIGRHGYETVKGAGGFGTNAELAVALVRGHAEEVRAWWEGRR